MPLLCVVMPVYNGEKFLAQAVESILAQTFRDFELIAIDDGSTDRSHDILAAYQQRDSRIKIHRQPRNLGLVEALNTGCRIATGEFIARMDADDISLPERFEKQLQFMEAHPEVGVLGTWIDYIDEDSTLHRRYWHPPISPKFIRWGFLFGPSLAHPTWMIRRQIGEQIGFYRPVKVEDYDFLTRASQITEIANIPETLLHYRFWSQSKSTVNAKTEAPTSAKIMVEYWNVLLGIQLSVDDGFRLQQLVAGHRGDSTPEQVKVLASLIERAFYQYKAQVDLNASDKREVATDASVKLLTCAALTAKRSPKTALSIVRQALTIAPTASIRFVQKAVKNLLERRNSV